MLDINAGALPSFSDPEHPSDAEVETFVDAFFALGAIAPEPVALTLSAPAADTENLLMEA